MLHSDNTLLSDKYPIALSAGLIDFLLILSSAYVAYFIRFQNIKMGEQYFFASLITSLIIILSQIISRCYATWRGQGLLRPLSRLIFAWAISLSIIFLGLVLFKLGHRFSRIWLLSYLAIAFFILINIRVIFYYIFKKIRKKGKNLKQVLILTDTNENHLIFNNLSNLNNEGFQIVKTIPIDAERIDRHHLLDEINPLSVHEIWLCLPLSKSALVQSLVLTLHNQLADIRYIPDLSDLPLLNHQFNVIGNMRTIDISCSAMDGPNRFLKRMLDLILGILFFIILLPIACVIYALVKLSSPGPAIFKQYRMGINGRRFKVYKFRTMKVHQEGDGQVTQAHKNDSRITRIGAFLRQTSLDEIPQFYNVLQGRMSIVGPRPHALSHNEYYKDLVESYMRRHKVKPGITGWAQVNGYRGETDTIEKMEKRVEHDLWYINNWSLWLDLKIIFLTIFKGFINRQP